MAIEYRGAAIGTGQFGQIATEFVRRQMAVILAANDGAALAAKRATATIPIVFFSLGSTP